MKAFIADSVAETFYSTLVAKKAFFLISLGLTPIIAKLQRVLDIEFLGFSLGILSFLVVLVLVDLVTGLKAAKYNGEELTSRKGYRTVDKLISYFMFICFTALLQKLLANEGYEWSIWLISNFKILVFVLIFLWEFHSVGENLKKRYGTKPRMFTVLDMVTKLIERKVIEKIEANSTKVTNLVETKLEELHKEKDDKTDSIDKVEA